MDGVVGVPTDPRCCEFLTSLSLLLFSVLQFWIDERASTMTTKHGENFVECKPT